MRHCGLVSVVVLLVCWFVLFVTPSWEAANLLSANEVIKWGFNNVREWATKPRMDADTVKLMGENGLQNAVPFLEREGVRDLEKLRTVTESFVDAMVHRHKEFNLITAELLKLRIRDKGLVNAIELAKTRQQEKAKQVYLYYQYIFEK